MLVVGKWRRFAAVGCVSNVRRKSNYGFARTGSFVQDPPKHENMFTSDMFLRRCLARLIPQAVLDSITPDLTNFGERVSTDIWNLGRNCELEPPYLRQTDSWGHRLDEVVTCQSWKEQKRIAAEEGLIAIAYERKQREFSRLYQVTKLYLYSPASGLYSCPLAMTDGAAKTLEVFKYTHEEPFQRLTSMDPDKFWTSGQWMTEKRGGSDVDAATETVAVHVNGDNYKLYGYKWFSSATDSDMTLTLARIHDHHHKGLSMFYLKTRTDGNKLNGIQVAKLKNKLGTRQLPTGELLLDGAEAVRISPEGRGIASITHMLTLTRLHNVVSSAACQRKITSLARDYATRRIAFGKEIDGHELHNLTLSRMETETRGCTILCLEIARLMGLSDCHLINENDSLILRLILPVAKMYAAKMAVATTSEGLECFGGQGYIEDTGLPNILRDAQVLPIWEGTSSVMSMDVLRAIHKSHGSVLQALKDRVLEITKKNHSSICALKIESGLHKTLEFVEKHGNLLEISARDLTKSLAHVYIGALLLEHAVEGAPEDLITAQHWVAERDMSPVDTALKNKCYDLRRKELKDYVYQGYNSHSLYVPKNQ